MALSSASPAGRPDQREPDPRARTLRDRLHSVPVWLRRLGASLLIFLALLLGASFYLDELLRRTIERGMNESLKGYTVSLPRVQFQPIGLSITLYDVTILQNAHPQPPVVRIPRLHASVQWQELLTGHLVADFLFERPELHLNLPQLRTEIREETPLRERGWQQAFEAIYPLKINLLRIRDATISYVDEDPEHPLELSHFNLHANNIRNIHSHDRTYPSPIQVETRVFDTGHGRLDGHADFLAEPTPGVRAGFDLEKIPLDRLKPMAARSHLRVSGGVLSTSGEAEYGPSVRALRLKDATIRGIHLDYVHAEQTAADEAAQAKSVSAAVRRAGREPDLDLRIGTFHLIDSDVGFVNEARDPPYRAFVSDADVTVENLSNGLRRGAATVHADGRFMGSGPARIAATFLPGNAGANFDLSLAIERTDMPAMNDLLRSYGRFDVAAGSFSLYSELKVRNDTVDGYLKPLFKDMKVYAKEKDADKPFFRKLHEKLVGVAARLLRNRARNEVATKFDLEGSIQSPTSSTWQMIGRLIQNAFFHSILPGFDEALGRRPP
ncbi:MAG: DUF748 domain-containing protein [Acidithiobacillales bacterium]